VSITASTVALPVLVQANSIGTRVGGTVALANGGPGVKVSGVSTVTGVVIGSTSSSTARNVISGNAAQGVLITGGAAGNTVAGNYIGLDANGANALANAGEGV
jgi:parallel beta-helix repeat protein